MSEDRRQDLISPPGPEAQRAQDNQRHRLEAAAHTTTGRLSSRLWLVRHDEEAILRLLRQVPRIDRLHARIALFQALGGQYTSAGPRALELCERVFGAGTMYFPSEREAVERKDPPSPDALTPPRPEDPGRSHEPALVPMLPAWHAAGRLKNSPPRPLETRLLKRGGPFGVGQVLASWDQSATPAAGARRHAEAEERLAEDHPALAVLGQGGGEPLPEAVLRRMNRLLGHNFSHVRIHTDASAAEAAQVLGARALALGTHVYFGAGQFAPGTPAGDRLLAHELVHVAQFDEGRLPAARGAGLEVSRPEDAMEREAEAKAQRLDGMPLGPSRQRDASVGERGPRAKDGPRLRSGTPAFLQREEGERGVAAALAEQSAIPSVNAEIAALEGMMLSTRREALKRGLLSQATFDATLALSQAMIRLEPAVRTRAAVAARLKSDAAGAAKRLYESLKKDTAADANWDAEPAVDPAGSTTTSVNRYTEQARVTTSFFLASLSYEVDGYLQRLPEFLNGAQWEEAFQCYHRLIAGVDRWVADQLLRAGRGQGKSQEQAACSDEEKAGQAHLYHGQLRTALDAIAGKNAKRLPAVFLPDPEEQKAPECGPAVPQVSMSVFYWQTSDGKFHLYDVTTPGEPHEQPIDARPTPKDMATFFEEVCRYPKGRVAFQIPDGASGVAETSGKRKWYEWAGLLGLGLSIGALISVPFTGGLSLPAAVVLAAGSLAGGVSAAGHLIDHGHLGTLTKTMAVLDAAQIVASFFAAGGIVAGGVKITVKTGVLADLAGRTFVPLVTTAAGADVVQLVAFSKIMWDELARIDGGAGTPEDKHRAMLVLVTQWAVMGGLTILSVQGARSAKSMLGRELELVDQAGQVKLRPIGEEAHVTAPSQQQQDLKRIAAALNRERSEIERQLAEHPEARNLERNETLGQLRDVHAGQTPKYGGYVLDSVLQENQQAVQKAQQILHEKKPDAILGMERGGEFLAEVMAYADPEIAKRIVTIPKTSPTGKFKFDAAAMRQQIEGLIAAGKKRFVLVDAYMGGRTAKELRDGVFKPLANAHPDATFDVLWLRETFGFEELSGTSLVLKAPQGGVPPGSSLGSQVKQSMLPIRLVLGDDMNVVLDKAANSREPIRIFNAKGEVIQTITPREGETTRGALIRLMNGKE